MIKINYFKIKRGIALAFTGLVITASAVVLTQPIKFDSRTTPAYLYPESYKSEVIRFLPSETIRYDHISGSVIYQNSNRDILMDGNTDGKLDSVIKEGKLIVRQNTGDKFLDRVLRTMIRIDQERGIESRLGTEEEFRKYNKEFREATQVIYQ